MDINTVVWLLSVTFTGTEIELLSASYGSQRDCIDAGNTVMYAWSTIGDLRTLTGQCQEIIKLIGVVL